MCSRKASLVKELKVPMASFDLAASTASPLTDILITVDLKIHYHCYFSVRLRELDVMFMQFIWVTNSDHARSER